MSRTYAHNSSIQDPQAEPHSFNLEGATARITEKNVAAGEYGFEIEADGRILQFRTNQEVIADNWVSWITACSNEKRYQDTLRQFIPAAQDDENADAILSDPVAIEKKVTVEIFKRILESYYDIVRRKLIDVIPKVGVILVIHVSGYCIYVSEQGARYNSINSD